MENLENIRKKIDNIDDSIIKLFEERMNTVKDVAEFKAENNMKVLNSKREREIINRLSQMVDPELSVYSKVLYNTLFDLSRSYQSKKLFSEGKTSQKIKEALSSTSEMFPSSSVVACQGTEGAYSQSACEKLFKNPSIMYFDTFKGIFDAVKSGMCAYGILPIENSIHGSVSEAIDLMKQYDLSIVKATKIHINHVLLKKPGTKEIKEIVSHEQALGQCDNYLSSLKGVKITTCKNTAFAAKLVSESERDDIACISSPLCADLYGLTVENDNIINNQNNYTRFVCISKKPEIYPGADKMSCIITLSHKPGALYNLISKFASVGINLTKIESRPIPGMDFEFMFYLEMSVSVYSDEILSLVSELEYFSDTFKFLGCYLEN